MDRIELKGYMCSSPAMLVQNGYVFARHHNLHNDFGLKSSYSLVVKKTSVLIDNLKVHIISREIILLV